MKFRTWRVGATVLVTLVIALISYQNCEVRRLSSGVGGVDGLGGSSLANSGGTSGTTGGSAGTTGTSGGGSTTGTNGSGGKVCMIEATTMGTVTGITGEPPIQSGMAILQSISQANFARTSLSLTFTSDCFSRADVTTSQKCPTPGPTPACDATKKSFTLSLTMNCSSTANATTCDNFTEGQVIDLSTATTTNLTLVASNGTSSCAADSYMVPFTGTKTGTVTVVAMDMLQKGSVFSLKLQGVQMIKNGTDTSNAITVDGTYAAEIVTVPACTP